MKPTSKICAFLLIFVLFVSCGGGTEPPKHEHVYSLQSSGNLACVCGESVISEPYVAILNGNTVTSYALIGNGSNSSIGLTVNGSDISYTNASSKKKSVIIKTSISQNLTINAPLDDIQHVGEVKSVYIVAVANNSYVGNASISGNVSVNKGHIVVNKPVSGSIDVVAEGSVSLDCNSPVSSVSLKLAEGTQTANISIGGTSSVETVSTEAPVSLDIAVNKVEVNSDKVSISTTSKAVVQEVSVSENVSFSEDNKFTISGEGQISEVNGVEASSLSSSKHVHIWDEGVISKEVSCTENGEKTYSCTNGQCLESKKEVLPALGHNLIHHDAKNATCTENGWNAYDICSRCDYSTFQEILAGHLWENNTASDYLATTATCASEATYYVSCSVCHEKGITTFKSGDKLEHSWDEGVVTTEPTYTIYGVKTYTCSECGETKTEGIPKLIRYYSVSFTAPAIASIDVFIDGQKTKNVASSTTENISVPENSTVSFTLSDYDKTYLMLLDNNSITNFNQYSGSFIATSNQSLVFSTKHHPLVKISAPSTNKVIVIYGNESETVEANSFFEKYIKKGTRVSVELILNEYDNHIISNWQHLSKVSSTKGYFNVTDDIDFQIELAESVISYLKGTWENSYIRGSLGEKWTFTDEWYQENFGYKGLLTYDNSSSEVEFYYNFEDTTISFTNEDWINLPLTSVSIVNACKFTAYDLGNYPHAGIITYEKHHWSEIINPEALKTEATCTQKAIYYKTCSECGIIGTDTFEYGEPLGHDWETPNYEWIETSLGYDCVATRLCSRNHIETETSQGVFSTIADSTCTTTGLGLYTASFENNSFAQQTKNVVISEKPHVFNKEVIDSKYLKTEATCETKAVYYKSCECGAIGLDTFTYGELLPHSYELAETIAPTCTDDGYDVYRCVECADEYQQNFKESLGGHVFVDGKCIRCDQQSDITITNVNGHYGDANDYKIGYHLFNNTDNTRLVFSIKSEKFKNKWSELSATLSVQENDVLISQSKVGSSSSGSFSFIIKAKNAVSEIAHFNLVISNESDYTEEYNFEIPLISAEPKLQLFKMVNYTVMGQGLVRLDSHNAAGEVKKYNMYLIGYMPEELERSKHYRPLAVIENIGTKKAIGPIKVVLTVDSDYTTELDSILSSFNQDVKVGARAQDVFDGLRYSYYDDIYCKNTGSFTISVFGEHNIISFGVADDCPNGEPIVINAEITDGEGNVFYDSMTFYVKASENN